MPLNRVLDSLWLQKELADPGAKELAEPANEAFGLQLAGDAGEHIANGDAERTDGCEDDDRD